MVGVWGTTSAPYGPGAVVGSVSPRCQLPSGGPITNGPSPLPAAFGTPFGPIDCPAGQAVTGVVGGQGAVVDAIALTCAPVPAPSAITAVVPGDQVAGGQMLTIYGTNLPAIGGPGDIVITQGGLDYGAQYVWGADASRVIARMDALAPFGPLAAGPATVRVRNAGDTVSTPPFPLTFSTTPGTPVLTAMRTQCGVAGTPITAIAPGESFSVEGDGIDTSGTEIVWTGLTGPGTGAVFAQGFLTSTGSPSGRVCSYPSGGMPPSGPAPAGLLPGTWSVQLRTTAVGVPSALSNAIVVTVPLP